MKLQSPSPCSSGSAWALRGGRRAAIAREGLLVTITDSMVRVTGVGGGHGSGSCSGHVGQVASWCDGPVRAGDHSR